MKHDRDPNGRIAGRTNRPIVRVCRLFALALLSAWTPGIARAQEGVAHPESGLIERTERHLIQLDVQIEPKDDDRRGEARPVVGADDLKLKVGMVRPRAEHVDLVCRETSGFESPATDDATALDLPVAARSVNEALRTTYLFYLDQQALTYRGRETAMQMVSSLARRLLRNGDRGVLVSSGEHLLVSPFGAAAAPILETLDRVTDATLWDQAAQPGNEAGAMMGGSVDHRLMQADDVTATSERLRLLAQFVGALADRPGHKVVFYFADSTQAEHPTSVFTAYGAFDDLTSKAAAYGVRLYTIKAFGHEPPPLDRGAMDIYLATIWQAEKSLHAMALETGGAFFHGDATPSGIDRVVERLGRDLDCVYRLSFDPETLPIDRPLPVKIKFAEHAKELRRHYRLRYRGQLLVPSADYRDRTRLVAAQLVPDAVGAETAHLQVIPLGYADGRFRALVQFGVPAVTHDPVAGTSWDLGITRWVKGHQKDVVSGRVSLPRASAPIVFETTWEFKPGASDLMSVGREKTAETIASARRSTDWPDPRKHDVSLTPIAAVQRSAAVFVRAGRDEPESSRLGGSRAVGAEAEPGVPLAFVTLACRGNAALGDLRIERLVNGSVLSDPEPILWGNDGEACVQVRDVVVAEQLRPGSFAYTLRVVDAEGVSLAEKTRALSVTGEPVAIVASSAATD